MPTATAAPAGVWTYVAGEPELVTAHRPVNVSNVYGARNPVVSKLLSIAAVVIMKSSVLSAENVGPKQAVVQDADVNGVPATSNIIVPQLAAHFNSSITTPHVTPGAASTVVEMEVAPPVPVRL